MIDLKTLSKQKYIYRIYESEDKVLHCEKYPIIYINSEVVYFKDGRKKEFLNYVKLKNVYNNFTEFYQNNYYANLYRPCFDRFFWNVEANIEKICEDLKKQKADMMRQREYEMKRERLERAKLEYEKALKEVEALNK